MAKFPETRPEMIRAGYQRMGDKPGACKGCGAAIEWWLTTNKRKMPFNPIESDTALAVSHYATCPSGKDFRQANPARSAAQGDARGFVQLQRDVEQLRRREGARVVLAIDRDGCQIAAWSSGISGEDLRSEIIAAANHVRAEVQKGGR